MVASLDKKKYRVENGVFAVEGTKAVRDTWDYFSCRMIIATKQWYDSFGHSGHLGKIMFASKAQLERMSHFSTASDVIAIYDLPQYEINSQEISSGLTIALDNIQDPGNLGTIIRIADWFGIKNIVCSDTTVDVFNHKVVQATMGAISIWRISSLKIGVCLSMAPISMARISINRLSLHRVLWLWATRGRVFLRLLPIASPTVCSSLPILRVSPHPSRLMSVWLLPSR